MHETSTIRIRRATEEDVPALLSLIRELAEYERLLDEVSATEEQLRNSLFRESAKAEALLAFEGDRPVGFAVFFLNYSTFLGRQGLYLEDLYVVPSVRRRGVGRRLLVRVARVARERGCGRLEWAVLDWNEPAIEFYRGLGAVAMDEWTVFRLTGSALERLAEE